MTSISSSHSTPHVSLLELNTLVRDAINATLPHRYWVEAELSEAAERRGHLFLDLVEKQAGANTPVARASAKCWASTWSVVRANFERVTGRSLAPGMKVLLLVHADFHPAFGFSWIVSDIDPTFTLGDMARRRQEIVARLREEGVFDLQRELRLSPFCQRVAVISSSTAAGYGDFRRQLADNPDGLAIAATLFPATMQGEEVEQSVIAALDAIYARRCEFDCVVIIRGGGAVSDMSGFDTLALAENVCNFPLPIITGIGHERDECVLDMVSLLRVKTPTAAAQVLITHLQATAGRLRSAADRLARATRGRTEQERLRLAALTVRIPTLFSLVRTREESRLAATALRLAAASRALAASRRGHLDILASRLTPAAMAFTTRERQRLQLLSGRAAALDPRLILSRGYSMTLAAGRIVTDARQVADGEVIETRLAHGTIFSNKLCRK